MSERAVVVGCGIMGLCSAIRLQEAGFDVSIVAAKLPPDTTSDVAAALWHPYKAYPEDRVLDWALRTRHVLEAEMGTAPGVSEVSCLHLYEHAWDLAKMVLRLPVE